MIAPDAQFILAPFRAPIAVFRHPVDFSAYLSANGQAQTEDDMAYYAECRGLSMTVKPDGLPQTFVVLLYDSDHGTVMHESIHTAWAVLEHYGVPVTPDSHEALAYVAEEIFNTLTKCL